MKRALLALLAVVNVLGVQDWLAFKRAQWETAEWLTEEQGVPLRQVDAAAQWDGLHFYEYALAHPEDRVARRPGDLWWLYIVAPMIDPVYIVAASPQPRRGYVVVATRPYDSWIRDPDESLVYVWRRQPGGRPGEAPPTRPRDGLGFGQWGAIVGLKTDAGGPSREPTEEAGRPR